MKKITKSSSTPKLTKADPKIAGLNKTGKIYNKV